MNTTAVDIIVVLDIIPRPTASRSPARVLCRMDHTPLASSNAMAGAPTVLIPVKRSSHLYRSSGINHLERSGSTKVLLFFVCRQPNIGIADATRCAAKYPSARTGDSFVDVGVARFGVLRTSALFASGKSHPLASID